VGEAIDIPRAEDQAAAKLKWIQPKFVLTMAGGAGAIAALEIIAPKNAKHIGVAQVCDGVRMAMFVDEQREVDPCFFLCLARSDQARWVGEMRLVLVLLMDLVNCVPRR
jgi:hypothetical protein